MDEGTRQKVEVEHAAGWRFLMFHGQFYTRLLVEQDSKKRIMAFTLKPGSGGIMNNFEGSWLIEGAGTDGKVTTHPPASNDSLMCTCHICAAPRPSERRPQSFRQKVMYHDLLNVIE